MSLSAFNSAALAHRIATLGQPILLGTTTVSAVLSEPMPTLDLATGGYTKTAQLRVSMATSALPAASPAVGQKVVANGKTYRVKNILPATADAFSAETVFECVLI